MTALDEHLFQKSDYEPMYKIIKDHPAQNYQNVVSVCSLPLLHLAYPDDQTQKIQFLITFFAYDNLNKLGLIGLPEDKLIYQLKICQLWFTIIKELADTQNQEELVKKIDTWKETWNKELEAFGNTQSSLNCYIM